MSKRKDQKTCAVCGGRLQSNNQLGVCSRTPACRREMSRRWRAANPEKYREAKRRWRAANPEKVREASRRWRAANPEKAREVERRLYAANPEKYREARRRWRAANPEKAREASRRWRAANPEKAREASRRREAWKSLRKGTLPRGSRAGMFCVCDVCGKPLGYRVPSQIRKNGTFCYEHKCYWRQKNGKKERKAV